MMETINNIVDDIKQSPTNMLALGRTILASERTLLAFISTSVGLLASGVGLIKLFENPLVQLCGAGFITASILLFLLGIKRYRSINSLLRSAHAAMKSVHDNVE